jgi:hypothetical protein
MTYDSINPTPRTLRRALLANGYSPLPATGKGPLWKGWADAEITADLLDTIGAQHPDFMNTGIRTGEVVAIDNDVADEELGKALDDLREKMLGYSDLCRVGRKPYGVVLYRMLGEPMRKVAVRDRVPDDARPGKLKPRTLVEVLGKGQQFIGFGDHPDTGDRYQWPNECDGGDPLQTPVAKLPSVTRDMLIAFADAAVALLHQHGIASAYHTFAESRVRAASNAAGEPITMAMLADMLRCIDPGLDRANWIAIIGALLNANALTLEGEIDSDFDAEEIFIAWSRGDFWKDGEPANAATEERARYDFNSLTADKPGGSKFGTLVTLARRGGYRGPIEIGGPSWDHTLDLYDARAPQEPEIGDAEPSKEAEPAKNDNAPYVCADGEVMHFPQRLLQTHLGCKVTQSGDVVPHPDFQNALLCARHLSATGARISFDTFHQRIVFRGTVPWSKGSNTLLDDASLRLIREQWVRRLNLQESRENVKEAIATVAHENEFHPVREYLDALAWDGNERIDAWLVTYLGADDSPYVRAIGRKFLIGAVARIQSPGIKFDTMLVFEGPQGQSKSRLIRTLAVDSDWFSDTLPKDLSRADAVQALQGKWLIEAAELQGMKSSDVASVKAFLSRSTDTARFAYGMMTQDYPRQCVIIGTTNNRDYLRDPTGARRFWPVAVTAADWQGIERDRDQLWAEAVAAWRHGEDAVLPEQLWGAAAEEQEARRRDDPWEDTLRSYLDGASANGVTTKPWHRVHASALLHEALGVPAERSPADQYSRLRDVMTFGLGWKWRKQVKASGGNASGYVRPAEPWEPADDE